MAEKIYKDFIPPTSGKKYLLTANADGTTDITDVTNYLQIGDSFGALQANGMLQKTGGEMTGNVQFKPIGRGIDWDGNSGAAFSMGVHPTDNDLNIYAKSTAGVIKTPLSISDTGQCVINGTITNATKATNAGNADTVDGSHAWRLQSMTTGGVTYGPDGYDVQCRFNAKGDSKFRLEIVGCPDAAQHTDNISVGHATLATNATNATKAANADKIAGHALTMSYNGNLWIGW